MKIKEMLRMLPMLALAGLLGCQDTGTDQDKDDFGQLEPDLTARHQARPKTDAPMEVERQYDAVAEASGMYPGGLLVGLATSEISPVSVGIVYREYWRSGSSEWKTAYGVYQGEDQLGRSTFLVEAPFEVYYHSVLYCRYAAFAVDGDSGNTYWDNNDRADFFWFGTRKGEVLSGWYYSRTDQGVTLDLHTIDMGYESLTVTYTLDNWGHTQELQATWTQYGGWDDTYVAEIPVPAGTQELAFQIRVEVDDGQVVADNSGHGYAVGLVDSEPAQVVFDSQGYTVSGDLRPGGRFQVAYDRTPSCVSSHYGFTWRTVEMGYRFYDDRMFDQTSMQQTMHDPADGGECPTVWCPEVMVSYPIYIPLNAQKLNLWFHHTGAYPSCSDWDSNNGNDYRIPLD